MPPKTKRQVKQPKTLQGFFRAREKAPHVFVFTKDGDAYCPPYQTKEEDLPERIFEIPKYRPITQEEETELDTRQKEEIATQIKIVEEARQYLQKMLDEYHAALVTDKSVVSANLRVGLEESKLSALISPQRWIRPEDNPEIRRYLLDNKYEKRRFNWRIYEYKHNPHLFSDLVKEITPAEQAALDAEAVGMSGGGMGAYTIFSDDSILGLHHAMDIVLGKRSYFTVYAAILGAAADEYGIPVIKTEKDATIGEQPGIQILGTRSARTLRDLEKKLLDLIGKQEDARVEAEEVFSRELLREIIETVAAESIDFEEALMKTGDQYLVYASPFNPYFSSGLESENPYIQNNRRWKGKNMWGLALMAARTHIRELAAEGKKPSSNSSSSGIQQKTITQDEQEKSKVGAIIQNRRSVGFQMSG